jgi:hypothetical protein
MSKSVNETTPLRPTEGAPSIQQGPKAVITDPADTSNQSPPSQAFEKFFGFVALAMIVGGGYSLFHGGDPMTAFKVMGCGVLLGIAMLDQMNKKDEAWAQAQAARNAAASPSPGAIRG